MSRKKRYITIQIIPDDSSESWTFKLRYRFFEFLFYSIVIALFAVAFGALKLGEINSKVLLANHLAQKNQVLMDRQKKLVLLEQEIARIYEQESRIRSLVQVFIRPENADSTRVAAKNQESVNYLNSYVQKVKALNRSRKNEKVSSEEFIPNIWPVSGIIGQKFMDGKSHGQHHGLDIIAESNALVVAAAKGIVIQAAWDRDLGKYVKIEHDANTVTLYAHLSRSFVQIGDQVDKGNSIGTVGNTGNSLGPHLHFEIFSHGNPVDPLHFLK